MGVAIKDGTLALSINLGNGRLDTGIKKKNVRFDDDVWHHVVIFRVAQQVNKYNHALPTFVELAKVCYLHNIKVSH